MSYEKAQTAIQESLTAAGKLGYIDLMLLHSPHGGREGRLGAWKALVEAQATGKIRSIGVSNYGINHLEELEEYIRSGGGGKIAVGQYEIHPWCAREEIAAWLKARGVVVEAYSPLVQAKRMQEPALQALSEKHGRTPAQVLIRWSLQKVCSFLSVPVGSRSWRSADCEGICAAAEICDRVAHCRECAGL